MKTIFTTGAHLCPIKIGDTWHWVVSAFEDDSFLDGESINPQEYSETEEGLIQEWEDDEGLPFSEEPTGEELENESAFFSNKEE